jgi:hypothetical protein
MTHITELALAAALIGALGLGALVTLPAPKTAGPVKLELERTATPVRRAEPSPAKSDAERVEALQRRVADIAAEQRELAATLRALAQARKRR